MISVLKKLVNAAGISGREGQVRDYIKGVPKIDDFIRLADMLHDKEVELKAFLDRKLQKKEKKIYFQNTRTSKRISK